jgi:predicted ArsR family transcriptional regulator
MSDLDLDRQLAVVASLGEPVRRALYRYVAGRGVPVGRDEAAAGTGISRPLAAYHLDKLVEEGLLDAHFERPGGRTGPGAGRPAKYYVRSARQVEINLPARDYELAARLLAQAIEADPSGAARGTLAEAARTLGAELGAQVAPDAGEQGHEHVLAALRRVLAERGYEPYEESGRTIRLRNCPFHRLAADHRELVCGANLAMMEGLADAAGGSGIVTPVLDPRPGQCCVAFRLDPER